MTKELAESVRHLAKPTVEALEKVTERKCGGCDGYGVVDGDTPGGDLGCGYCKGSGKERWKWEPKVGECFYGLSKVLHWIVNEEQRLQVTKHIEDHKLVPLLGWEEIKRILEGMGHKVKVRDQEDFGKECRYNCGIYTDKLGIGTSAPTCQEATMLATIELAKKLK